MLSNRRMQSWSWTVSHCTLCTIPAGSRLAGHQWQICAANWCRYAGHLSPSRRIPNNWWGRDYTFQKAHTTCNVSWRECWVVRCLRGWNAWYIRPPFAPYRSKATRTHATTSARPSSSTSPLRLSPNANIGRDWVEIHVSKLPGNLWWAIQSQRWPRQVLQMAQGRFAQSMITMVTVRV